MKPENETMSVPTESRPTEPKFHVGQIVVMKGLKTAPPFRIIDMKFAVGEWCYRWNRRNYAAEHMLRDLTPEESSGPKISIEVYQQDWKPGFACFLDDGSIAEGGKAHVGLNLAAFLGTLQAGDVEAADLPYVIAESLMHEVIHVLESWAKIEFNEERVEALLRKYHDKYRPDAPIYEKCEPRQTPEEQAFRKQPECANCSIGLAVDGWTVGREEGHDSKAANLTCGCRYCWHCSDNRGRHEDHTAETCRAKRVGLGESRENCEICGKAKLNPNMSVASGMIASGYFCGCPISIDPAPSVPV